MPHDGPPPANRGSSRLAAWTPVLGVAVLGALSGGVLHYTALHVDAAHPVGWRAVDGPASLAPDRGLPPRAGTWSLGGQTAWFSRAALPGRGLRSLSLELELPPDGSLDLWLSRRTSKRPDLGDVLLRMHHGTETTARLFTWDSDGPRAVTCLPTIQPGLGATHAVSVEAAEGMLNLTVDGNPSVCTVVGGSHPPALQAGHHSVRVAAIEIDGRPVPAPNPGPLGVWMLLGGLLSGMVARLERTTGAGRWVTLLGEAAVGAASVLALIQVLPGEAHGLRWVLGPIAIAGVARLGLHVGRALRPIPERADWTPQAAVGAIVPTVGLLVLATPGTGPTTLWLPLAAAAGTAVALGVALAGRPRPWRAVALIGGLVSCATLVGRVLGAVARPELAIATLAGLALAGAAAVGARRDRRLSTRGATLALLALSTVCIGELLVFEPPPDRPGSLQPPGAPVGPLPVPRDDGVLVSGPLAIGHHDRGLRPAAHHLATTLGRPVHPVGDGTWGVLEIARAVASGPTPTLGVPLVVTSGPVTPPPEVADTSTPLPGLTAWARRMAAPFTDRPDPRLLQAARTIAAAAEPAPLVFVSGTTGPDAAPARALQAAFAHVAAESAHVHHLDFADRAVRSPEAGWVDPQGRLTERAWTEVAASLQGLLPPPRPPDVP